MMIRTMRYKLSEIFFIKLQTFIGDFMLIMCKLYSDKTYRKTVKTLANIINAKTSEPIDMIDIIIGMKKIFILVKETN